MERSADWFRQAERDLEKARHDLEGAFFEWACFTSHQAAEKALKAVFQSRHQAARGHALLDLLRGLAESPAPGEDLFHAARILDRYYIEARCPNGFPSGAPLDYFDRKLAQEALDAAEAILRFCRSHLDR